MEAWLCSKLWTWPTSYHLPFNIPSLLQAGHWFKDPPARFILPGPSPHYAAAELPSVTAGLHLAIKDSLQDGKYWL